METPETIEFSNANPIHTHVHNGQELYRELMFNLLQINSITSKEMWRKLSEHDKDVWELLSSGYDDMIEQYHDLVLPNHIEDAEQYTKSVYLDSAECGHTCEEAEEMWKNLSHKDKELLILITSGIEV